MTGSDDNVNGLPDIELDAEKWARAKYWTWEEAEYLLVGLDHCKIVKTDVEIPLELKRTERKLVREALEFHFRHEDRPETVPPTTAIEIAIAAGIEPPKDLASAVAIVALETDRVPIDDANSANGRQYNKALKMLLAVAVARYQYDPIKTRQPAVNEMVRDGQLVGLKFNDATLRARLREAVGHLDEDEEYKFSEFLAEQRAN